MSDVHASDTPLSDEPHGLAGHDDGHDDHGHAEDPLGPIDWPAWTAGVIGVLLGLAVAWCFFLSIGGFPAI